MLTSETKRQREESYLDEIEERISWMELIDTTGAMHDGWITESGAPLLRDPFKIPKRRIIYFQSEDADIIERMLCTSQRLQRLIAMLPSFGCCEIDGQRIHERQMEMRAKLIHCADSGKCYSLLYHPPRGLVQGQTVDFQYVCGFDKVFKGLKNLNEESLMRLLTIPCYTLVNFQDFSENERIEMLREFTTRPYFRDSVLLISSPDMCIPKGYQDRIALIEASIPMPADIEAHLLKKMGMQTGDLKEDVSHLRREAERLWGMEFSEIDRVVNVVKGKTGYCCETEAKGQRARKACVEIEQEEIDRIRSEKAKTAPLISMLNCDDAKYFTCPPGYAQWLDLRVESFRNSRHAARSGEKRCKGVLMAGVPGTGKTMAAKYTAKRLGVKLVKLDIAQIMSKWVGESQQHLQTFLRLVKKMSPVVLLIDEIEKVFQSNRNDTSTQTQMRATLLNWMQDENDGSVFCFFTANDVSELPPELIRKGRLSERFFSFMPSAQELANILCTQLRAISEGSVRQCEEDETDKAEILLNEVFRERLGSKEIQKDLLDMINCIKPKKDTLEDWKRMPLFFTGADMDELLGDVVIDLNNREAFRKGRKSSEERCYSFEEFKASFLKCAGESDYYGSGGVGRIAKNALLLHNQGYKDVSQAGESYEPLLPFECYNEDYRPKYERDSAGEKDDQKNSKNERDGGENDDQKIFLLKKGDWRMQEPPGAGKARHYDYYLYHVMEAKIQELRDKGLA